MLGQEAGSACCRVSLTSGWTPFPVRVAGVSVGGGETPCKCGRPAAALGLPAARVNSL